MLATRASCVGLFVGLFVTVGLAATSLMRSDRATTESAPIARGAEIDQAVPSTPRGATRPEREPPPEVEWREGFWTIPWENRRWAVEARIRLDDVCPDAKPPERIVIEFGGNDYSRPTSQTSVVDFTTSIRERRRAPQFHLYRVERRGNEIVALVDGRAIGRGPVDGEQHKIHYSLAIWPDCASPGDGNSQDDPFSWTLDYFAFELERIPCERCERRSLVSWDCTSRLEPLTSCQAEPNQRSDGWARRTVSALRSGRTRVRFDPLSQDRERPFSRSLLMMVSDSIHGDLIPMDHVVDL